MPPQVSPFTVLIAEDEEVDRIALQRAFEAGEPPVTPTFVLNGLDLMDLLKRLAADALPGLILLDLNLPGMDGRDILKRLKCDARFRGIPVVILTGSTSMNDVSQSLAAGADGYFNKPSGMDGMRGLVRLLGTYWLPQAEAAGSGSC